MSDFGSSLLHLFIALFMIASIPIDMQVSDFGLSQVLPDAVDRTQVSKNYSGTVTHMPPELIEEGKVYPQGDVYAFGIMMWETYTGSAPYAHMVHPQIMVAVVTHNLRPRFPEGTPDWYKVNSFKRLLGI